MLTLKGSSSSNFDSHGLELGSLERGFNFLKDGPKKPKRVKFDLRRVTKFLENFCRNFKIILNSLLILNGSSASNFEFMVCN